MTTLKIAVVGLGKMGLSHFSMVNAHPDVETIACDGAGFLVDVLGKNIDTPIYKDFDEMDAKYPATTMKDGWNNVDGERVYYVSNPALGLWAHASRL